MSEEKHCSKCGKPVPGESPRGICPACLMEQAMASRTVVTGQPDAELPPPPSPEEIADKFPQYEVLECLGRGGMGVVYKARQKSLDRWVAIKVLAPERVHEERFAEHFEREAKTLAKMSHPNIVTVFDHGETGGLFYIVMEFVDGVNLRDLLREGKMEPEQALVIVPPICDALQYAHDKGIVHRDIKPENILLDREGRVKIADFGIASLVGATGENSGTPPYMAPEQSGGTVDRRADIYALGVVLYEMLTGERPAKELVAPSRKVEVDVKIDEMVLRALEKEPERRYQTAGEFRTMVQTIAATPSESKRDETRLVGEQRQEGKGRVLLAKIGTWGARYGWLPVIAIGLGLLIILGAIANFNFTLGVEKASMMMVGSIFVAGGIIGAAIGSGRKRSGEAADSATGDLGSMGSSEKEAKRWKSLRLASFLGFLVMMVSIAGIIFIVKVVPQWEESLASRAEAVPTGMASVFSASHFIQKVWPLMAPLLLILGVGSVTGYVVAVRKQNSTPQHLGPGFPTHGSGNAIGGHPGPAGGLSGIWSHAVVLGIGYLIFGHGLFITGRSLAEIKLRDGDSRGIILDGLLSMTQGIMPVGITLVGALLSSLILLMFGRAFGKRGPWIGSFVGGLPIFATGVIVGLLVLYAGWQVPGTALWWASLWLASAWLTAGFWNLRKAHEPSRPAAWWSVGLAGGVLLVILLYLLAQPTRSSADLAAFIIGSLLGLGSLACGIATWRTGLGRGMVLGWATCAVVAVVTCLVLMRLQYDSARSHLAREQSETSYGEAADKLYESEESDSSDELSTPSGNESVPPLQITGPAEEFTQDLLRGWVENRWKTEYPHETFEPLEWGVPKAVAPHDWVTIRCKYRYTPPWTGKTRVEERYITFTKTGDFVRSDIVEGGAIKVEEPSVQSIARLVISKERGGQISPDGVTYSLDGEVVAMEKLLERFQQMVKERPELQVIVYANDPELSAGRAIAAMQTARAAGVKHVRIDTGEAYGEEPADAERGADGAVTELKIKQPDGTEEVGSLQPEGIDLLQEILSREPDHVVPADRGAPLEPPILLEWQGNKYAVQSDKIVLIGAKDWTMWLSPGIDEKLIEHSDIRVIKGAIQGTAVVSHKTGFGTLAGAIGFPLLTALAFLIHRRINPDRRLEITALFLCVAGVILPLLILIGHLLGMEQAVVATVAFVLFAVMQLAALILGIIRFSEPLGRAAAIASGVLLLGSILFLS